MKRRWLFVLNISLILVLILVGAVGCREKRGSLEGTMMDADGKPISGATVRAGTGGYPGVTLETDENGYYKLSNMPAGLCSLEFYDGDMILRGTESVIVRDGEVTRFDFTIRVTPDSDNIVNSNQPARGWEVGEHFYYSQNCIWGDLLVGLEFEYEEGKIVGHYLTTFDLNTHEKKRVLQIPEDRLAGTPSIYQNKIVWDSVDRNEAFQQAVKSSISPPPNHDVFLLDLETNEVQQLTTEEHAQRSPGISGDTVVWLDARNQPREQYPLPFDVYIYDLKTGQEKRITQNTTAEGYSQVAIHGNIIVWTDIRHADIEVASHAGNDSAYNNEIYVYDLTTGEERRLTTSPYNDRSPDISGDIVTWLRQEDYRKADIFAIDLESGVESQISKSNYAAFSPSIFDKKITWTDARSSKGNTNNDVVENGQAPGTDIYLYDLKTQKEIRLTETEAWKVRASPVISGKYLVYQWNRQIGSLVYIMDLASAINSETTITESHNLIPVKDMGLLQSKQKAPDDIMPAPGLGPAYRANIHQQGVENPWPSIEVSQAYLKSGADDAHIYYRSHIETAAGETQNNIIKVIMSGTEVSSLSLYADGIPQGITLTDGMQWSGPFSRASVLVIEIAPDVMSGEFHLEIGLLINGKDYGTIPCTVNVQGEKR